MFLFLQDLMQWLTQDLHKINVVWLFAFVITATVGVAVFRYVTRPLSLPDPHEYPDDI